MADTRSFIDQVRSFFADVLEGFGGIFFLILVVFSIGVLLRTFGYL